MGSDIKKFRPWKTKVVVVFLLYLVTVHVIILGSTQRKNKILRFCGLLPTGPNILPESPCKVITQFVDSKGDGGHISVVRVPRDS